MGKKPSILANDVAEVHMKRWLRIVFFFFFSGHQAGKEQSNCEVKASYREKKSRTIFFDPSSILL